MRRICSVKADPFGTCTACAYTQIEHRAHVKVRIRFAACPRAPTSNVGTCCTVDSGSCSPASLTSAPRPIGIVWQRTAERFAFGPVTFPLNRNGLLGCFSLLFALQTRAFPKITVHRSRGGRCSVVSGELPSVWRIVGQKQLQRGA